MNAQLSNHFETPSALRHDVHQLSHDAEELLQATRGAVDDKVKNAREQLARTVERSRDVWSNVEDTAVRSVKKADRIVHEHPYPTAAAALGIGALLGAFFVRRF